MIKSIEIKNFKAIKSKYFPLRNLNIVAGMNGQGKSSFIQSLLLLRQSEGINSGVLKLNNGLVKIGTTKDALYQYSKKEENLSFALQFKETDPYLMEFGYEINADQFNQKSPITNFINENRNEALFSNKFQYLNAQRIEPSTINSGSLTYVEQLNDIGKYGEYTAHFIELRGAEAIAFDNLLHKDSITYDELTNTTTTNKTLLNQINLWLGEISPGVAVKTNQITSDLILLEYTFKQPNLGNTNRFKPENVGFGISYALHVVTALLKAKPGDLLIIENPESHIHPRGQAELGKLISLVAQNDIQIIIETHSDHILNGIRVGIKTTPKLKDKTILFYFEKVINELEQYAKITNIQIDEFGELSEYPKNLLNEWSNQLLNLL